MDNLSFTSDFWLCGYYSSSPTSRPSSLVRAQHHDQQSGCSVRLVKGARNTQRIPAVHGLNLQPCYAQRQLHSWLHNLQEQGWPGLTESLRHHPYLNADLGVEAHCCGDGHPYAEPLPLLLMALLPPDTWRRIAIVAPLRIHSSLQHNLQVN